jgi:hypothetical protein
MFNIEHGGTFVFVIIPGIPGFYWVTTGRWTAGA